MNALTAAKFAAAWLVVLAATAGTFYLGCQGIKMMYKGYIEKNRLIIVSNRRS